MFGVGRGTCADGLPRVSPTSASALGHPGTSLSQAYTSDPGTWGCQYSANCKLFCFLDVWCLLLLGYSTQQELLRYWRDIPLHLLSTAEGDALNLPGGEWDLWQDEESGGRSQWPPTPLPRLGAWHSSILPQRECSRAEAGRASSFI